MPSEEIENSVLATVRYFDLFDQPVTVVQLWQRQVGATEPRLLHEVRAAAIDAVANGALETSSGFYFLPGREELVHTWLRRHTLAQQKWKLTRRIARWLQYVPFVKMMAMSGSLAAGNTRPSSDLDLFVIVQARRIWLARLGLLAVTELLGRRRRHWDQQAPDKVCLNHYVTDESLIVAPDIQNLYTAVLYHCLISLANDKWREKFLAANRSWMNQYVAVPPAPSLRARQALVASPFLLMVKGAVEALVAEPLFDWLETGAEKIQRLLIEWHTNPQRPGRVVINSRELAFHPDTKVPALLKRYYQHSS